MRNKVREYYERNPLMVSSPFGGIDGVDEALYRRVFARLRIDLAGRDVLDVGCGRGHVQSLVAALGGRYTGADLVASGRGFPLVLAEGEALPFPDGAFDALLCVDVFEHFQNEENVAREFRRVLRPQGLIFMSVPNYGNVAGLVKLLYETIGLYEQNTWAPFRQWKPQELEQFMTAGRVRRVFRAAGFRRFRRIGHGAEVGLGLFPWVEHAKMPEAVRFRLQRLFGMVGPAVAAVAPGASLHGFWKIEG